MSHESGQPTAADLSACEKEPIHVPDAIQPQGCLLVVDPESRSVLQASANCSGYPGINVASPVGQPVEKVLSESLHSVLEGADQISPNQMPQRIDLNFGSNKDDPLVLTASLFRSGPCLVIELEVYPGELARGASAFRQLEQFMRRAERNEDSLAVLQTAVNEVAESTGYDHVMAYRFDRDWNGEVIAEHLGGKGPSFLGHCFPASDIPAQARALYAVNPIRHTPDVDYDPVPIAPATNTLLDGPLDMTHCASRSISPIHREYMRNMGVYSSLSLSLMLDGQLWGMILCHHPQPRHIAPLDRAYLQMLARATSDTLRVTMQREVETHVDSIVEQMRAVLNNLDFQQTGLLHAVTYHSELLSAFEAETLILRLHGERVTLGREVPDAIIRLIEEQAKVDALEGPVSSDRIMERVPGLRDEPDAAWLGGFLYARLSSRRDDALLFLRSERVKDEIWAGDPDNPHAIEHEEGLPRIHPRRSFEAWRREVRGCSLPWGAGHRVAADRLMSGLARHLAGEVERLLRHKANHDALTQLPNRMLLDDRLQHVLERAKRTHETVVLLFLDLDGFKPVNDEYGHEVGDNVLITAAQCFSELLRDSDTVARVGGDEFVFMLEGFPDLETARENGRLCAQRLVDGLESLRFEQQDIRLSASVGIAIHPLDGDDPDELIRYADEAMYRVKGESGPRYCFSTPF